MFLKNYNLKDKILCCCSGGVDSLSLAFLLLQNVRDCEVHVVIVNHNLRENSEDEAKSVSRELKKMGYQNVSILDWIHHDTKAKSEEEARDARFSLIFEYAAMHGIQDITLGHHASDLIENFFLKLGNGAGIFGLSGLKEINYVFWEGLVFRLIRPLLSFSKEDILKFAKENSLQFVTDETNESPIFKRNRLRKAIPNALKSLEIQHSNILCTSYALERGGVVLKKHIKNLFKTIFLFDETYGFFLAGIDSVKTLLQEELFFAVREMVFFFSKRMDQRKDEIINACNYISEGKSFTLSDTEFFFNKGNLYVIREVWKIKNDLKWNIWDGRFEVFGLNEGLSKESSKLSKELSVKRITSNICKMGLKTHLPAKVIKTLPSVWRAEELLAFQGFLCTKGISFRAIKPLYEFNY